MKNMAGDLVKFETTPTHSSASHPAERTIQSVEEQFRTIRADCQMRFGSSETSGADKPIWAWLLRHAGWQISGYKPKYNEMTAYKQASAEHYTLEVVPFAEIVLVRVPKPTHRGLQGRELWHKGEPSRRHDAGFRGRPRKEPAPPPPVFVGDNTQRHNPDVPDKKDETHSETPKEIDNTSDPDNVPMSETPLNESRDASHIQSNSLADTTDGVRQLLKFDGEASGMTPDPKRSKETVKQGETRVERSSW